MPLNQRIWGIWVAASRAGEFRLSIFIATIYFLNRYFLSALDKGSAGYH
jgi:hypothetical protein